MNNPTYIASLAAVSMFFSLATFVMGYTRFWDMALYPWSVALVFLINAGTELWNHRKFLKKLDEALPVGR